MVLGGSRFGWSIVSTLAALLGVALLLAWIYTSYLGIDVTASVSFVGTDGWCDDAMSGLGVHCFGDYSSIDYASLGAQPSEPEAVYPVSSRLLRLPFYLIASVGGFQAGLLAFVVISAMCLLSPALWSLRGAPWFAKGIVLTAVGLGTVPFLFAWDRGNLLALTIPFLLLVILGLMRQRPWLVTGAIIVCATVRPQFALLALALVAVRQWKPALVSFGGSIGAVVASFFLFGSAWLSEIGEWIKAAGSWSQAVPLSRDWPGNVSVPRALYSVVHTGPWADSAFVASIPDSVYTVASLLVLGVAVLIIVAGGRRLPSLAVVASLLAVVSLALPLSYGYYFVFALPLAAVVFREGLAGWPAARPLDKTLIVSFFLALVLSLTPLLIPMSGSFAPVPGTVVVASLVPILATLAWVAYIGVLTIRGVEEIRSSRRMARGHEAGLRDG
jgi:hypothetical protein